MSDDVLRTARQLLSELDASEAYLRTLAVTSLPWANVIGAERRAGRRCAELLAALGGAGFELRALTPDDSTDELLTGAVRARDVASPPQDRPQTVGQVLAAPDVVGPAPAAWEPFDDGPEGAADEGNDLRSESEEVETLEAANVEDLEPEPFVEDDTDETPVPAPSLSEPMVSFGDASSSGSLVSFDDPVAPTDDEPTLGTGLDAAADEDAFGSLVSYDEPALDADDDGPAFADDDEDDGETIIGRAQPPAPAATPTPAARAAQPARFSDVGTDALVGVDERASDLLGDSLDDELQELELENSDSFDLMPDISEEEAGAEDEEVTMVRAADSLGLAAAQPDARGKPMVRPAPPKPAAPVAVAPSGAAARVTAGLYGGSTVPTIRDSDDPRPRAAAIQLNAGGSGGKVLGLEEEEEPIEIGAAEDYDEDAEVDLADGFSVTLQAQHDEPLFDDDDEEEEEEEEEDEEVIEPARGAEPPAGPTAAELQLLVDRAYAAASSGDLQGGAEMYTHVLDLDPDHVGAHVARGRLYLDLGDYSRAMSDFMVAEDIAPNDPEPQVAIGDLYFARKDYRKAIDYFNAALEIAPNHPMAYCRRGISHYYRKNYQEALTDLLKAEKMDPDIPNIQTYVSMARKKVKR